MKTKKLTKEDKRDIKAKKIVIRQAEQEALRIQIRDEERAKVKAAFIKNNTENADVPYDSVLSAYQELSRSGHVEYANFGVIARASRWTIEALHDEGNGCNRFAASVKSPAFAFAIILACMYPQLLQWNNTLRDLCSNIIVELPTENYNYADFDEINAFAKHLLEAQSLLTTDARKVVYSTPENFAVFLDRVFRQFEDIGYPMLIAC